MEVLLLTWNHIRVSLKKKKSKTCKSNFSGVIVEQVSTETEILSSAVWVFKHHVMKAIIVFHCFFLIIPNSDDSLTFKMKYIKYHPSLQVPHLHKVWYVNKSVI